jgi:hypothetical protein
MSATASACPGCGGPLGPTDVFECASCWSRRITQGQRGLRPSFEKPPVRRRSAMTRRRRS